MLLVLLDFELLKNREKDDERTVLSRVILR
jgi:hypothetical protein